MTSFTRLATGAAALTLLAVAGIPEVATSAPMPSPHDAKAVYVPMVDVGDAGNTADPATGFGSVGSAYRIASTDITIGQYARFLNAVASERDEHALYNPLMANDLTVAGIRQVAWRDSFRYEVIAPQGAAQTPAATASERPITYVSWFDAARFANWMSNGQPRGRQTRKTTETGAYNLTTREARSGTAVSPSGKNPNTGRAPLFTLPTENQWYKAAYYNPTLNSGAGGYFDYATQSSTPPGNSLADPNAPGQANYTWAGKLSITQALAVDPNPNYLTNVGSFTGSAGPFGTYDMNGNVWEWNDGDGVASPVRTLRGGGWTSYYTYLQSTYRLGNAPGNQNSNGGFRLASTVAPVDSTFYSLVQVDHPGNAADTTGYGAVASTYSIGTYEVTIGQYSDFLNAVADTDVYGLYNPSMATALNSAGISRTGGSGAYVYAPINNAGDSTNRPATFVSWFDVARFANWMSNGRPTGAQSATTTEDGAYTLNGVTTGATVSRNAINPNTTEAPTFSIPTENQWYKAAYYSPLLNAGAGGYYLYATQSNTGPGNTIGSTPNQVNYINDYDLSNTYSVTRAVAINVLQNYLTDVGYFRGSPSYYGAYDLNGNVYNWNDLDGTARTVRGLRGGFWFSGPPSIQRLTFAQAGAGREANDTGIRLAAR